MEPSTHHPWLFPPSASVQGHRVDVLLSPIDPLSMESHHFLAIFILAQTIAMHVREIITVQNIEKWELTKAAMADWGRVDPGFEGSGP
jgi:hypothetical protein